jgi:replicative DNA helicase
MNDAANLRVPPQDVQAEQAVLGGLMLAPEVAYDRVSDVLTDECQFYRRDHQLIYRAIRELHELKKPYDAVTLGSWFESHGLSEQVAGGAYLIDLASTTPSAANVRAYAEIVAEKAQLRRVIEFGTDVVGMGYSPDGRSAEQITADAAGRAAALTLQTAKDGGLRIVRNAVARAYDQITKRYYGEVELGMQLPWPNLAKKIPGLEETDLLVLAARPSMGKTAAGMEIADYAADTGRNVAVFSMEMSEEQLMVRLLSKRARVSQEKMRAKGALSEDEWERIGEARRALSERVTLAVDDQARLTIDKIRARASRMHAKVPGGLGLIVVDYLQMIEGGTGKEDKRHDEVTKISRGLKQLAKDLRCPVIALGQLNRSLESRPDKRPVMSDLRESGAIEQDADIIVFIYRDDYYSKDQCGAPGVTEFIVAKQRNGPTGTAYLQSHLDCSYFEDYHGQMPPRYAKTAKGKASNDGLDDEGYNSGKDRAAGRD